ncbi:MAG: TonB-dependent receptor [Chitinophagaceae bacterium]|nr:TonB-dependent receptor [Chitinophagaceae bacterium]
MNALRFDCILTMKGWIMSLLLTSVSMTVFAQAPPGAVVNSVLEGDIIDSLSRRPLESITVNIKGTTNQTQTDKQGHFKIRTGQRFPYTLIVSSIGYRTQEVEATGAPLNIQLRSSETQLSDVVVVGYGTQTKRNLVGSIAVVNAAEVNKIPVASFDAQLQGKAAGVQIVTNSGIPGEAIFVRVRGTTSINSSSDPLYIVDGVFLNNTSLQTLSLGGRTTSPLADINPSDIDHIEVLKDASATAIYGSRGANGVVIITTKKGNYNSRSKVTVDALAGWVQADKSTIQKLASGPQSATLANEWWINSGIDNPALNRTFANRPFRPVSEGGQGLPEEQKTYDRISDILHHGTVQNYNASIQGGSNNSRYYLGLGYTDQEALIRVPTFSRENVKFNFDQKLSNRISFGLTNNFSRSYRNQAFAGDGPQVNLWNSATSAATYTSKYATDGTSVGADNTYILMQHYDVNTVSLRYIGGIYAEAEIWKGLKFRSSFNLDYDHYSEYAYWDRYTSIGLAANGQANSTLTQNSTWINEQTLSYVKELGSSNLSVVIGNSEQSNVLSATSAVGKGFANDNFRLISSASQTTASQNWTKYSLASFFGRVAYNYAAKYYAEASFRADGSSKFGANNRWGYFPAFGLGWRLKEEAFLKDVDWLSELKLRGSYGITGNQAGIDNFAARGLWTGGSGYADVFGTPLSGIAPQQLGNPDLKWEKTAQTDIGLNLDLFKNRISLTVDVYRKYTSGLLLQRPIPGATGFSTYWANVGELSNEGYEVNITSTNIAGKDFSWRTSLNIAGNRNKIEKLPSQITQYTRDWVILKQGYSMNSFWLYHQLYVDPKTGASVFEGQDANGAVTTDDRRIYGNAYPKIYGGITNTFTYKDFDLGILFTFQSGNKSVNLNRYFRERNPSSGGVNAKVLQRWQKPGDITDVPRLTSIGNNYTIDQNSRYLEDASFLRLKELTIGYNLPKSILSRINLTNARIYFIGTNLKLWSKYTGDPESNVTSNPNAQGLGSFGTPPQPVGYQFGINVTI